MEIGVALLCTIVGAVLGIISFARDRDKEVKKDASYTATIDAKLDNINQGVQDIRVDIKAEQKARMELSERVVRVEESAKQAHHRITKLENEKEQ